MEREDYLTEEQEGAQKALEASQAYEEYRNATNLRDSAQIEDQRALDSGERLGEDDTHKTKDASEFGFRENAQELVNVVTGAVRDEVSSVLTAGERIIDMSTGEMQRELEETGEYVPDWNPLGEYNPETKTKWGNILRGALGYAAFAIPVGGVAKSIGLAGKAAKVWELQEKEQLSVVVLLR